MSFGYSAETEVFRPAVFSILGRNQDDHTKHVGYLMDRLGRRRRSPAFGLTCSFDPAGRFYDLREKKARTIIEQIGDGLAEFPALAGDLDLPRALRGWRRRAEPRVA